MKRSEAIHKLRDFLSDRKVTSVDTLGALSHSIIQFLEEEIGMLPPLQNNLDFYTEPYQWEE